MKQAVFFDRDGVINELVYDKKHGFADSPTVSSQVRLVYGVVGLIKGVKKLGFLTIICSNQPSLGLGKTTLSNFQAVTNKINNLLEKGGATLDYHYYCLHHPFARIKKYKINCNCRKPKIGLFLKAAKDYDIDLKNSWIIGDGVNDVVVGKKAGCKSILLANINSTENLRILEKQLGKVQPDFVIKKLPDALNIIKDYQR